MTDLGHDSSVDGWGIQGTKGHDFPNIFEVVGSEKGELLLIRVPDSNLVIAGFGVEADKIKGTAGSIAKIIQSVITAGDGKQEGLRDSIERAVVDTETPYKVFDVVHMFLMRFRCEKALA